MESPKKAMVSPVFIRAADGVCEKHDVVNAIELMKKARMLFLNIRRLEFYWVKSFVLNKKIYFSTKPNITIFSQFTS